MSVLSNPLSVQYNGTELNSISGVTITQRTVNDIPGSNLRIHKLARTDGSVLTTKEFTQKILQIGGVIMLTDRASAEAALDSLRAVFAKPEGNIDVLVAGATRRWVGTLSAMSSLVKGGYVSFTIELTCSYPFGSATSDTTILNAVSNTLSSTTFAIANAGSYRSEPVITITYSAISGGTGQTVTLSNIDDGQSVQVTRNWLAGDVLIIDNLNKTIQVNNVNISGTGNFLSFLPGGGSLTYSDTFTTSRTMTVSATYRKRYT